MKDLLLTEEEIVDLIIEYLVNKGWNKNTLVDHKKHQSGVDIDIRKGKHNGEHFLIECKKKSHSKSAKSVNKEGWLTALGQLISRMKLPRVIEQGENKGEPRRDTKYGLGLYWIGAQVALRRIPSNVAKLLNLYIFQLMRKVLLSNLVIKILAKKNIQTNYFINKGASRWIR